MLRCAAFLIAAALVAAIPAPAAPSFDCTKAATAAEKQVCEVPDLQWSDRQLARLYKLALAQSGAGRNDVVNAQRAFIARRNSCGGNIECLDTAYKAQFKALAARVNVYEAFGEYEPEGMGGSMRVVRFGYDAAISILTVGGGDHTCTFETDSAPQGGKGVIRYADKGANACRLTVAPDGDDAMVVRTKNCSDYCGMRAILDGRYSRIP
jgi:uncharacterized protein